MADTDPSQICSSLWNSSSSSIWSTERPNMDSCSRHVLLRILPCILLFLLSPSEFLSSARRQKVPWRFLNILRILVTILLSIFFLDQYSDIMTESGDEHIPLSLLTSSILLSLSYMWLTFLLIHTKIKGFIRSGVVWIFVTISLLTAALDHYFVHGDPESGESVLAGSHVYLYAVIILWILCCIPDHAVTLEKNASGNTMTSMMVAAGGITASPAADSPATAGSAGSRREVASFPSCLTFSWVTSLAFRGRNKVIDMEDLHPLVLGNGSSSLGARLRKNLIKKTDYQDDDYGEVVSSLVQTFCREILFTGLLRLVADLSELLKPLLIKVIIVFLMDTSDTYSWHGYFLACLLLVASVFQNITHSAFQDRAQGLGIMIRTSLQSTLYRKALTMSIRGQEGSRATREIMFLSSETESIRQFTERMHMIWSLVIQVILCLTLIYYEIGASSLTVLIPILLVIGVDFLLNVRIERANDQQCIERRERMRHTSEMLHEIRSIKLQAWEESFESLISQVRSRQVRLIQKIRYWTGLQLVTWNSVTLLFGIVVFTSYVTTSDHRDSFMTPASLFFTLYIFTILKNACKGWPDMYSLYSDASSGITRLNAFLAIPDLRKYICHDHDDANHTITMEDASFAWNSTHASADPSFRLRVTGIIRIPQGSLAVIVGDPKSGKTSLVSAVLGEMELLDGRVNISPAIRRTAYVSQQPWLMNGTIKENILFGKLYESVKYLKIVTSCDLEEDFALLPGGDMTMIGEQGQELTASQCQRIALARACYSDADLYILDQPLSLVEPDVRRIIHHKVLSSRSGILKKKTRLVVAASNRGMNLATEADRIFVLRDGRICEWGTFSELSATVNGTFAGLLKAGSATTTPDVVPPEEDLGIDTSTSAKVRKDWVRIGKRVQRKSFSVQRSSSFREPGRMSMSAFVSDQHRRMDRRTDTEEDEEEESRRNRPATLSILAFFCKRMSAMPLLILPGYLVYQVLWTSALICLTNWSSDEVMLHNRTHQEQEDPIREDRGLITFAIFGVESLIFLVIGVLALAKGSTIASRKLHDRLLHSVLRSRMTFFDLTPVPSIMARFTTDLAPIDSCFFEELSHLFIIFLEMIASLFVLTVILPYFSLVFILLMISFIIFQRCYTGTAAQVKKMDEFTSAVILSSFSQMISGASVIRAFGMAQRFIRDCDKRIDRNQVCTTSLADLNQWRGLRMELLGNIASFAAAVLVILSRGEADPAYQGLALVLASQLGRQFSVLMRATCFLEHESSSVHRIIQMTNHIEEHESDWHCDIPPPDFWPPHGAVRYYDLSARYRPGLDLAIRSANFLILPQEKIGVVGRHGSGKSTIAATMMRMIEPATGTIVIDGIDVSTIGVMDLRSRITIMTQVPVILSGNVRRNLDPFYECTDEEIWWALELAHLKDVVWDTVMQLQQDVSTMSLSMSQRQLVSLARALLFKKRILILDEATGAVDPETEALMIDVIRDQFADCTIINMTDHLSMIMDSDRVLVMEDGRVAEFDSPDILVSDPDSLFFSMAKEAGLI